MKTTPLELVYAFFCETVRVEASGQITPVGIWGDTIKFEGKAPTVLPALAFHAFIRNIGKKSLKCKIQFTFPGVIKPWEMVAPIKGTDLQTSQNLNVNLAGIPISATGDVVARVHIDSTPPVEREFRLHLAFPAQQPAAKAAK
jgi:hypothetical protein